MLDRQPLLATSSINYTTVLNQAIYKHINAFHYELLNYFETSPQHNVLQPAYAALSQYIQKYLNSALNPELSREDLEKKFANLIYAFNTCTTQFEHTIGASETIVNIMDNIETSLSPLDNEKYASEKRLLLELIDLYQEIALILHNLAAQEQSDRKIDELQAELNKLETQSRLLKEQEQQLADIKEQENAPLHTLNQHGNEARDIEYALEILERQIKRSEKPPIASSDEKHQSIPTDKLDKAILHFTYSSYQLSITPLTNLKSAIAAREESHTKAYNENLRARINATYENISHRLRETRNSTEQMRNGIEKNRKALVEKSNNATTTEIAETNEFNVRLDELKKPATYPRLWKALKFAGTLVLGAAVAAGIIFSGGSLLLGLGLGAATAIGFSTRVFRNTKNSAPSSAAISYVTPIQNTAATLPNSSSESNSTRSISYLLQASDQSTLSSSLLSKKNEEHATNTSTKNKATSRFTFAAKQAVVPIDEDDDTLSIKYGYI